MPNNNSYISAETPISDESKPKLFSRIWFRFFELVSKKIAILEGTNSTTATAGAAGALPATPAGYLTIVDNTGVNRKVPYYNE